MSKSRSHDEEARSDDKAEPLNGVSGKGVAWNGFGLWNVFFLCEFLLSHAKYINIHLLYNAVLACWLILPTPRRWLKWIRNVIGFVGAVVLLYSESWLPSLSSFFNNLDNLREFSFTYFLDFFASAINWDMLSVLFVLLVLYYLAKDWINVTAITSVIFLVGFVGPVLCRAIEPLLPVRPVITAQSEVQPTPAVKPADESPKTDMTAAKSPLSLDDWLSKFYADKQISR